MSFSCYLLSRNSIFAPIINRIRRAFFPQPPYEFFKAGMLGAPTAATKDD